jgi:hypothetical protein
VKFAQGEAYKHISNEFRTNPASVTALEIPAEGNFLNSERQLHMSGQSGQSGCLESHKFT